MSDSRSGLFRFSLRRLLLGLTTVCVIAAVAVNLPSFLQQSYDNWKVGKEYDWAVFSAPGYDLRVTALTERGTALAAPGVFYRYEVRANADRQWRLIAQLRFPFRDPIPRDQFRIVSHDRSYFFNSRLVGITTDGGKNWACTSLENLPLAGWPSDSYAEIASLDLAESGAGTLTVSLIDTRTMEQMDSQCLTTEDFGKTWGKEASGSNDTRSETDLP